MLSRALVHQSMLAARACMVPNSISERRRRSGWNLLTLMFVGWLARSVFSASGPWERVIRAKVQRQRFPQRTPRVGHGIALMVRTGAILRRSLPGRGGGPCNPFRELGAILQPPKLEFGLQC